MKRGALILCLLASACVGGPSGGAPISYGSGGQAPPRQAPAQYQPAPAYAPPQPNYAQEASSPPPTQQEEVTALSAYALQPETADPRNPPRTHTIGRNESL